MEVHSFIIICVLQKLQLSNGGVSIYQTNVAGQIVIEWLGVHINSFLPSGCFHPYQLDESICQLKGVWFIYEVRGICGLSFVSFQLFHFSRAVL